MTSLQGLRPALARWVLPGLLAMPMTLWAAPPTHYTLDAAKSTLEFEFVQAGARNKGKFLKFPVTLDFTPNSPGGKLDVTVDIASLNTQDKDRDTTLLSPDLFDAKAHPQAHFLATQITSTPQGFVAQGQLTLRGVTKPTTVPFTFRTATEGGQTVGYLSGSTTVRRLDFGVGQGEWKNTGSDGIANDVKVTYSLRLTAAP